MMALISIIIPFYNSEKTIGRTLDSLNRMSHESKEITEVIVVDDGSKDRGPEIVESKKKDLLPLKVVMIRQENKGSAGARNTGLEQSRGGWVLFLDADDELALDPIPFIQKWPYYSALAFPVQWVKEGVPRGWVKPAFITPEKHLDILTSANPLALPNFIINKDRITALFDTRFIYLEDWIFWFDNPLIFENMKVFRNKTSAYIHAHGGNKSSNYGRVGVYREMVAEEMRKRFGEKLTRKQRNNLLIQEQIGSILQGKKIELKSFFHLPCNIKLYGKFIIYSILRTNFSKFDIYGS